MFKELDWAYSECSRITKSRARNCYYAFLTLPVDQRKAIYTAYAFCRLCDDIADGNESLSEKRFQLNSVREKLRDMEHVDTDSFIFKALNDTRIKFGIPVHYFETIIDGVESDLVPNRYNTFDDLRSYCYKVASVVGLISIEIFGYDDPSAKAYAIDLGIAMQLTNILRDIREDSQLGRIYIPAEEIEMFNYSESQLTGRVINDSFRDLMAYQVDRARMHFVSSRPLIDLLPPRSRACPMVLAGVYTRLLVRMESVGYDVFSNRISLGTTEKFFLMVKLWFASLIPIEKIQG